MTEPGSSAPKGAPSPPGPAHNRGSIADLKKHPQQTRNASAGKRSIAWSEDMSTNDLQSRFGSNFVSMRSKAESRMESATEEEALRRVQPTMRARNQLILFLILAVVAMALAMGLGMSLTGNVYDYNVPIEVPENGQFKNRAQVAGIYLQVYLGTLGVMLFGNFIPGFVVLRLPYRLYILLMAALFCGFAVAMALCVALLIKPEVTFTDYPTVTAQDPITSSSGVFFFLYFSFLAGLCAGILVEYLKPAHARVNPSGQSVHNSHLPLDTWYGKSWHWLATTRLGHGAGVVLAQGRRKAVAFIIVCVFLMFTVSNFMCNPVGGSGETFPGKYFQSTSEYSLVNWEWSTNFVFKLFPDVLVFYLFIIVICIGSILLHLNTNVKKFLHRRIWTPKKFSLHYLRWHPFPVGVAAGEVLLFVLFIGIIIYWVCYWRIEFTYLREKAEEESEYHLTTEISARLMGHMSNLFLAFIMLPASRTGLMVEVFGVPYERTLKYHRLIGLLAYVMITCHACTFWLKFAYEGNLFHNAVAYNSLKITPDRTAFHDFTVSIMELAWLLLTISLVMAVTMRRRYYEWFQYSHKFIGIVFYTSAMIHGWTTWYYSCVGLLVWACDKWSRSVAASRVYIPEVVEWHERNETVLIKLSYVALNHTYEPGQYFFVNIPEISLNEWHPFTASAVLEDGIVFCIKKMGSRRTQNKGTWTQRLAEKVMFQPAEGLQASNHPLSMRLSGPFGHADFRGYERILLVAGGIGITPMIAIFASLKKKQLMGESIGRLKHVQLVWMSRSVGEFRLFEQIFSLLVKDNTRAAVKARRESFLDPIPAGAMPLSEEDEMLSEAAKAFSGIRATTPAAAPTTTATTTAGTRPPSRKDGSEGRNNGSATLKETVADMASDVPRPDTSKTTGSVMQHTAALQAVFEGLDEEFVDDFDSHDSGTVPGTVDADDSNHAEGNSASKTVSSSIPPPSSLPALTRPIATPPALAPASASQGQPQQQQQPERRLSSMSITSNGSIVAPRRATILPPPAATVSFAPPAPTGSTANRRKSSPVVLSRLQAVGENAFSLTCNFELGLFCTKRESFISLTDPGSIDYVKLFIHSGRCDLGEVFDQAKISGPDCLAAVCGPSSLTLDVSSKAWERGSDFHSETFFF